MKLVSCLILVKQLPLNTSGTVTANQFFHLGYSDHIIVTLYRVLPCRSRCSKLHCALGRFAAYQGVDESSAKAVSAAHTSIMCSSYFYPPGAAGRNMVRRF